MAEVRRWRLVALVLLLSAARLAPTQAVSKRAAPGQAPKLDRARLAQEAFGADAPWYEREIPFLEIDDPEIQQIYYYRWKLYRSHVREIGRQGTTVLEFLPNVPWARQPFTDLNDSASFHLTEGRWMRDAGVVDSLIDHLYTGGANDRHFSESIAAAANGVTLVTGDARPALKHLDTMQHIYNLWDDHLDRGKGLYWIEPLLDATEYTISSIDASGAGFTDAPSKDQNHNGFTGGYAFRPSINSYQFGNALAIARLAEVAGQGDVAAEYRGRAEAIRAAVLRQLWNPEMGHFVDRYQRSTGFVTADQFIRGRELVGYVPWFYELPPKADARYTESWKHVLAAGELGGAKGLRTVEPSYPKYMVQYRYDRETGLRECQWNGPSWPFQTSQALTGMANLLEDYPDQQVVTKGDYLRLLRQYTRQHFLTPGHPDIQEDYNPDEGGPIVGLPRSHHYSHSTYVDLVLSGLVGIRPRADAVLEVSPLLPEGGERPIGYFAVEGVRYHGHDVAVVWDRDGRRYGAGKGLSVYVDGHRAWGPGRMGRVEVPLRTVAVNATPGMPEDVAVNVGELAGPVATASSAERPEGVAEGIDGRMWFFPEIRNGWSPKEAGGTSWYAVDLREAKEVRRVELYFFGDGNGYGPPAHYRVEYRSAGAWTGVGGTAGAPVANGVTVAVFPAVRAREWRVVMEGPAAPAKVRLVEMKAFAR